LGVRAGVDFAYLEWQLVHGAELDEMRARPGVRWIRATTDIAAMLQQLRCGTFSPRQYFRSLCRPLESAIWAADDPLPAICEIPSLIAAKRRLRRSMPRSERPALQAKVGRIAAEVNSLRS